VDISRKVQVWSLLAAEADRRRQPLSIAVACHAAVHLLGVDGAAVAAVAPGEVHVSVFATSALGRRLGDLESSLGEGPSLQAYAEGAPVLTSDLARYDTHWPLFGSAAVEMGVRGLFAFPLRSGTVPIGVFHVHRAGAGALTAGQLADALLLADIMALLLLGPDAANGRSSIQDAISTDHHIEVYQATGMVSVHLGVSLADALARLRGHAFAHGRPISAVARDIVRGRLRLDEGDSDD
jgi:hypothetical protein